MKRQKNRTSAECAARRENGRRACAIPESAERKQNDEPLPRESSCR